MSFHSSPLISLSDKGLYCEAGDFYIDPHRAVEHAVVTHAHSDHARRGSKNYYCEQSGVGLLKVRIGKKIQVTGIPFEETFTLGKVKVSFHSAGHILGSAQVRVEYEGEVWVASGDYKRDPDPSCKPFKSVKCDTFITEATFGTPKFVWDKNATHGKDIQAWWDENASAGRNALLFGYSLGKTQRILGELAPYAKKPILLHSTMGELTQCYRDEGIELAPTRSLEKAIEEAKAEGRTFKEELILAPPSIQDESFNALLGEHESAFASGWVKTRNPFSQESYTKGFLMSDHADWNDLMQTIVETGAKTVYVQHRSGSLIRALRKKTIQAHPVEALKMENYIRLGGRELSLFEDS